jgi:rhodanese-related sulfurtransferase
MKKRFTFAVVVLAVCVGMVSAGQGLEAQGSLQQEAEAYFSEGPRTIQAADLYENLNDGDPDNDPTIISLRSAEDYAKGHIPGAVNVSVKELFTTETLSTIPPDKDVVLVCYTGQTAGQATAALNMLGYEAYSLLFGMSSWTTDPEVFVKRFDPEAHAADYGVETESNTLEGDYALPTPLAAGAAEAAQVYFSEGPRTIQAADLFENLNDGDTDNDPTVISLRSAEDYAKGHVPGAVNVSVNDLFTAASLATIPPDRDVVVICYTGQTAGQATAALNMLGYEAYSLLHGMSSWTTDSDVFVKRFDPETHASDYAVETEANVLEGMYEVPFTVGATATGAVGVGQAAQAYFGEGPKYISATDLYENLNDGDADNDPTIISVRSAEDYAKGHIPGAVNMSITEMFTPANLATIPPNRQVVVVCYTGQSACQVTAALNMLGYDAYSLLHGMSSWTTDPDVYVRRFDPETTPNDYTVDTEPHEPSGTYGLPSPLAANVVGAAQAYFGEGPNYISATDLYENLNDGDADNDPTIISVRSAEDYAKGHIPGAVNMSITEMFTPANLATIPPDRQVVVVCYTGQSACQVTAALNMLGYDAYSLLYGMSSWTTDPDVYVRRYDPETAANDYTVDIEPHEPSGTYELPFTTATGAAGVEGAAQAYFGEGPRTIQAVDLYENLNDGDPDNDPTIISLRSAEDYAKGHIPGAVNISVTKLFTTETLRTIPPDKDVVLVCYTGQTAGHATAGMNMLGYDAYSLLFGMSSWTTDPEVYVKRFNPEVHTGDYPIDTEPHQLEGTYDRPSPLATDVAGAAEAYYADGAHTIDAAAVYENLNDGDPDNDPTIISLRSAEDYAKGHVPGAVNVSVTELFTPDTLSKIPPDRPVVLVCYTGQTAGQAAAAMQMLGYEACSLLFGMSSWTTDPGVFVKRFDSETHAGDYPVDTEPHELTGSYELPTPLAAAGPQGGPSRAPTPAAEIPAMQAAATNCITCHTNKTAMQTLAVEEEEEIPPEEASGEG